MGVDGVGRATRRRAVAEAGSPAVGRSTARDELCVRLRVRELALGTEWGPTSARSIHGTAPTQVMPSRSPPRAIAARNGQILISRTLADLPAGANVELPKPALSVDSGDRLGNCSRGQRRGETAGPPPAAVGAFRREGDFWVVAFDGQPVQRRHRRVCPTSRHCSPGRGRGPCGGVSIRASTRASGVDGTLDRTRSRQYRERFGNSPTTSRTPPEAATSGAPAERATNASDRGSAVRGPRSRGLAPCPKDWVERARKAVRPGSHIPQAGRSRAPAPRPAPTGLAADRHLLRIRAA